MSQPDNSANQTLDGHIQQIDELIQESKEVFDLVRNTGASLTPEDLNQVVEDLKVLDKQLETLTTIYQSCIDGDGKKKKSHMVLRYIPPDPNTPSAGSKYQLL